MKPTSPGLTGSGALCGLAETEQGILSDPAVGKALRRIINKTELCPQGRKDLLQEALVYLWSREEQHPGQQLAWYLRAVKFYLKDIRRSGRSVDSPKRRGAQVGFSNQWLEHAASAGGLRSDDGIHSEINARDTFCLLAGRLGRMDRIILGLLANGLGIRDIAYMLGLSHTFVVRHRRRIAKLATTLEIGPRPGAS
jgi:DNA-directed RNA polymerase specialized sigma24 family protein